MQSIRPSTLLKTASGLAVLAVCAACSQEVTPARAVPVWLTVLVHPTISTDVFRKWWISVNP